MKIYVVSYKDVENLENNVFSTSEEATEFVNSEYQKQLINTDIVDDQLGYTCVCNVNDGVGEAYIIDNLDGEECRWIASVHEVTKAYDNSLENAGFLEEILNALGSKDPFLEEPEIDEEGYMQPFTESGAVAYRFLTDIIYAIGNITGIDAVSIVDELDEIANESC